MSHRRAKRIRKHFLPIAKVREVTKDVPGGRRVSRGVFMRETTAYRHVKGHSHLKNRDYIIITLAKCARMVVQSTKRRDLPWGSVESVSGSS